MDTLPFFKHHHGILWILLLTALVYLLLAMAAARFGQPEPAAPEPETKGRIQTTRTGTAER